MGREGGGDLDEELIEGDERGDHAEGDGDNLKRGKVSLSRLGQPHHEIGIVGEDVDPFEGDCPHRDHSQEAGGQVDDLLGDDRRGQGSGRRL